MSQLAPPADPPATLARQERLILRSTVSIFALVFMLALGPAIAKAKVTEIAPATAAAPGAGGAPPYDPYEKMNRRFYASYRKIDGAFFRPAALAYERVIPRPLRMGIRNFLSNVHEPIVLANDILQLRLKKAARTVARFAANSTVGVGGLWDVATPAGLPHHDNGFGLTLARYGVTSGPYLFLPLVGPTTFRDLIGAGVDLASDPMFFVHYPGETVVAVNTTMAEGLDARLRADPDLQQIDAMATDPYATLRSLYLQNREAQIRGGHIQIEDLPDFGDTGPVATATEPSDVAQAASPSADVEPTPAPAEIPAPAAQTLAAEPAHTDAAPPAMRVALGLTDSGPEAGYFMAPAPVQTAASGQPGS